VHCRSDGQGSGSWLDGCVSSSRAADGLLVPAPRKIPDGFEVVTRSRDESVDVALVGELDMPACFGLESEIEGLLDERGIRRMVLDLAELEFLDSAGLGSLLTIRDRAQDRDVDLRFVNPSRPVRRILEATGTAPLLLG
jgi:anti-anti-sigma factor